MPAHAPPQAGERMFWRSGVGEVTIWFEGNALSARAGDSVATALLANNIVVTRTTALSAAPRGPYCMMGACFECLATVGGRSGVQTCMIPVRDGMRIARHNGARELPVSAWTTT